MSEPVTHSPYIAALLRERAAVADRPERLAAIDDELRRHGQVVPAVNAAPVQRSAPPRGRRRGTDIEA